MKKLKDPSNLGFDAVIIFTVACLTVAFLFAPQIGFMNVAWAVTDGMDINFVNVYQYDSDTSLWVLRANFTSSGGSVRISDSQQVRFEVGYKFNKTLADSEAYAYTNTTVTMNITVGIWNNVALNTTIVTGQSDATYYYLIRQGDWNATLPVGGTTYTCTFLYRGYY
jgi:hypothetical protein